MCVGGGVCVCVYVCMQRGKHDTGLTRTQELSIARCVIKLTCISGMRRVSIFNIH